MAASHVNQQHLQLARQLHPKLLAFFRKHPPAIPSASSALSTTTSVSEIDSTISSTSSTKSAEALILSERQRNPFLPFKHPISTHWHPPTYSLRTQSSLIKLAQKSHVLPLLPLSPKSPEVKLAQREESGLRVKGTGKGQRVKGKMWERTLKGRLEDRKKAMVGMEKMVQEWKARGHGRGWKKWPK